MRVVFILHLVLLNCIYDAIGLKMSLTTQSGPRNVRDKTISPINQAAKLASIFTLGNALSTTPFSAFAAEGFGKDGDVITVIGANGKTGSKAVELAALGKQKVFAVTRGGKYNALEEREGARKLIKDVASDVTHPSTYGSLQECFKLSQGVIFAASASKSGGTPQQVDRDGVIEMAKLCIENKVPRFVVVSSGAVTKPSSPVYLFLNVFGGIMKAKMEGENELRKLYNTDLAKANGCKYTIIRPGGLTEEPSKGVSALELNQGDDRSGRISRWDVAALAIECIKYNDAENATFECYDKNTAQPLANVGINNILKKTEAVAEKTGFERNGDTFAAIFKGLVADKR